MSSSSKKIDINLILAFSSYLLVSEPLRNSLNFIVEFIEGSNINMDI